MADRVARLLAGYQHVLVGRFSVIFPASLGRFLTRALGVQAGVASYYLTQAHAFANTRQYEKAIKACQASVAVRADFMPAYETLVQVLAHTEHYQQALEACVRALEVSPEFGGDLRQLETNSSSYPRDETARTGDRKPRQMPGGQPRPRRGIYASCGNAFTVAPLSRSH